MSDRKKYVQNRPQKNLRTHFQLRRKGRQIKKNPFRQRNHLKTFIIWWGSKYDIQISFLADHTHPFVTPFSRNSWIWTICKYLEQFFSNLGFTALCSASHDETNEPSTTSVRWYPLSQQVFEYCHFAQIYACKYGKCIKSVQNGNIRGRVVTSQVNAQT